MTFDIVSLREMDDGSWLALILEGERLAQFRFVHSAALPEKQMRSVIRARAAGIDDLRALEQSRAFGDRIRRVVDVTPPLAAAA